MRVKTWNIIDSGEVPEGSPLIPWECHCGNVAQLPVVGRVLAVTGGLESNGDEGIVFDTGYHAMPTTIQCRKCGRVTTTEKHGPYTDVR